MNIFKKTTDEEATMPLVAEENVEPVTETEVVSVPDQSVYNCPDCTGEGLVTGNGEGKFVRCAQCNGTGKVK